MAFVHSSISLHVGTTPLVAPLRVSPPRQLFLTSHNAFLARRQRLVVINEKASSGSSTLLASANDPWEIKEIPGEVEVPNKNAPSSYDGPGPGKIKFSPEELEQQKKALRDLEEKWKQERLEEEAEKKRIFGLCPNAEMINGRFAMFFLVVGLLTEYWTGESLPQQVETMLRVAGLIG